MSANNNSGSSSSSGFGLVICHRHKTLCGDCLCTIEFVESSSTIEKLFCYINNPIYYRSLLMCCYLKGYIS